MIEKKKRRILSWSLTLALAVSLTAGLPLTAAARDQDIIVFYTNDAHCGVDDNIGYAGLVLYEKEMLQQPPYVTPVDAGDAISVY